MSDRNTKQHAPSTQDDGDPHYIPPSDSYKRGLACGEEAAQSDASYLTAHSLAMADSIHYPKPLDFMKGFIVAFRDQEARQMAWG